MDELEQLDEITAADPEQNEWQIYGPPGCGKTYYSSRQIERAVAKYGPGQVMACSFTKAAAVELAGRTALPKEQLGTIHAHCYHALNRPTIAESKAAMWNEEYPQWAISGASVGYLDEPDGEGDLTEFFGDDMLAEMSRYRNQCLPIELWPNPDVKRFHKIWEPWKQSHNLMDFTDLLETAARDIKIAPGSPRVILVDEAQDSSALQLKIIRNWGRHAEYYVVVGDDDQTLYTFIGATPDAFLTPPLPASRKIVLSQSFRVPRSVHRLATWWIERVARREPKVYQPRDEMGEVVMLPADQWGHHPAFTGMVVDRAEEDLARGHTVMILAACSYMLAAVRKEIMDRGLPFHNPYRRRRNDWNPLSATRGTPASARVLAYLVPFHGRGIEQRNWTGGELKKAMEWLAAGQLFQHGAKTRIRELADAADVTPEVLDGLLQPEAYDSLIEALGSAPLAGCLDWWLSRVLKPHVGTASYPVRVAVQHGIGELEKTPRLMLGTIHSVKGGEADSVYLFPDLSPQASDEWTSGNREGHDAIVRQFYVGMTRAKKKLTLCPSMNRGYSLEF